MKTIIHNATIINEGKEWLGSVVIEGEHIAEVTDGPATDLSGYDQVIDGTGLYLLPGIIDSHVHFREPGMTEKADIASESRTAAAGGVTSYIDMPNCIPPTTTLEALEEKHRIAAEKSRVNYSFFFGATNTNLETIKDLDPSVVPGVKVYMGSTTGGLLVDRERALYDIFGNSPLLLMTHCEDTDIINQNIRYFKKRYKGQNDFPVRYHSRIRTTEACFASSSVAVKIAKETGARLHIAHVSSKKELDLFRNDIPLEEKRITCEVVIPHLMFCSDDYDQLGCMIKCNPAVKSSEDREALRHALSTGIIDVVSTDHAPHLLKEKQGGALKALSGMPMVQFSLVSMLELSDKDYLSRPRVVDLLCHNQARLFKIGQRGYIRKGFYADLVLVDPDANWQVLKGRYYTKCGWTPMDERTFKWKVRRTIVNGKTAYCDGIVIDGVRGKALRFG